VLVTKRPLVVSHQYAASALWPAGRMAERSLSETPNTRGASGAFFGRPAATLISSPSVLTRRRRGDAAAPEAAPTGVTVVSVTLVTLLPVARSNQSLPMMPLTDGVAPVSMVECPTAVTVG